MVNKDQLRPSTKILILDEHSGEIKHTSDVEDLASMIVWKDERMRRMQLKKDNSILVAKHGEKLNVFQYALENASVHLGFEQLRVFIYLLSICDFENWIQVSQSDIGKKLKIAVPNVSRALKGVAEKQFIFIIKKGGSNYYRINPEVGWKGSFSSHKKVLEFPDRYTTDTPH